MRRAKPISVRVRAPSRGLVSRLPGESADLMQAQGGIVPGSQQRAASRASNVRFEDGVAAAAPGYQKVVVQTSLLDGILAHWTMDESAGTRADVSGNGRDLSEVTGYETQGGPATEVLSVPGKFAQAASFPGV